MTKFKQWQTNEMNDMMMQQKMSDENSKWDDQSNDMCMI